MGDSRRELSLLISDRLEEYDCDECVKQLVLELLKFERRNSHKEKVHYKSEYRRIIDSSLTSTIKEDAYDADSQY
jgi:hypothetical protein